MVKCAECGYLAVRHSLAEVNEDGRKVEIPLWGRDALICFSQALDFRRAVDEKSPGYPPSLVLNVLQTERNCPYFTKWQMGFSPKEHRDMIDRQWRLEQEDKRRKSDRMWHFIELAITLVVGAVIALVAAHIGTG